MGFGLQPLTGIVRHFNGLMTSNKIDITMFNRQNNQKMEFNPNSNVVKLCIQGMDMEEKGKPEEAGILFLQAWNEATT